MKKETVEMYIYEPGDVLDISRCKLELRECPNSSKTNRYRSSNRRVLIVGVERRVPKPDKYSCLLSTGKVICFNGTELNEARFVGNVDMTLLFKEESK